MQPDWRHRRVRNVLYDGATQLQWDVTSNCVSIKSGDKWNLIVSSTNRADLTSPDQKRTDAATNGFKQPFLYFITGVVRPRTIATRPSFVAWNTDINISYLVFCCPRGFVWVWTFFVGFQLFSLFLLHFSCDGLSWRSWLGLSSDYDWQVQCEDERSQVDHHVR